MSILTKRKDILFPANNPDRMPTFRLGADLAQNIEALRVALGSATRRLSRDDLAEMISERLPHVTVSGSAIRWWESRKGEPGVRVIAVMAELAGVSFERFALGARDDDEDMGELADTETGAPLYPLRPPDVGDQSRRRKGGEDD